MINRKNYRRINMLMLVKVMGWLVMIEGAFMILPLAVSLYYSESDWNAFAWTIVITTLSGLMMAKLAKPNTKSLGKREGYLLTASVWVVFSLFGMIPFIISPAPYSVVDAFTEAMSGLTTTGATIIEDVETLSHGIKMWRSLMQWIGGLGIILFTLAVIPMLNHSGGMQMFNAEVTGITHGKLKPRISQTAKSLWGVYIILTGCCVLLLWLGPLSLYESVNHALSTIATGGFSIYNDGVEHFTSNYIKIITIIFMFLGSINFAIIFGIANGRFKAFSTEEPLRVFISIIFIFTVILVIIEYFSGIMSSWGNAIIDTLFMVVSSLSSTSYTVGDVGHWPYVSLCIIAIMIFIGGCAGSTSGGAKIDRIIILAKYMRNEVWHALQPNSITSVRMSQKNMQLEVVEKVIAFLALYVVIIIFGTIVLAAMNIPIMDSLFTSLSCISNSGICIDVGHLNGSLASIPEFGKLILAFIMLTGRLEIYTVLVILTGNFWHK